MRVQRLWLHPFGRFDDASFDLGPGLTVVYGPNEAGKSTLHQALLTAVGGIRRGNGRRPEVDELRNRYRPWQAAAWRVAAIVELADGARVELSRNLDQSSGSQVVELGTGRDRAGEIIGGGASDGWRWLGLDRVTYPATASVSQADVLRVGDSAGLLAEHLQRAADAAGADATAARAIARITAYQREQVGSLARSSVRPLRRAIVAEEQAAAEVEAARRAHDDYLRLAARAQRLEHAAAQKARERRVIEAALAAHLARDERRQLDRLVALEARHAAPPPDRARDDRMAQAAAAALQSWRRRRDPTPVGGPSAAQLRRELAALPEPPRGETVPDAEVERAAAALAAAAQGRRVHEERRPPPPPPLPTTQPVERLQDLARALDAPAAVTSARSWATRSAPLLVLAGVIAALGVVALTLTRDPLWVAAAAILAPGITAYAWTHGQALPADLALRRDRLRGAVAEAHALGLPVEPAALRGLARQVMLSRQREAELERWHGEREGHLAAERAAQQALGLSLAARGADDLEGYRRSCEARREALNRAALREPLRAQLEAREELEREAERAAGELRGALTTLRAVAADVASPAASEGAQPDQLAALLEGWLRQRDAELADHQEVTAEWAELCALRAGGSREERVRQLGEAEREARALADGIPSGELARAIRCPQSPARVRALAAEEAAARREADHARGELDQHPARRLSVPDAQAALDQAVTERRRLEDLGKALDLARSYLESAQDRVHRDLAPVLAGKLAGWLPDITAGRYVDANVDPATLSVTVCGPDRHWKSADLLSRGTQEQIYLLLRLALVEQLTRKGESAPLLLDEVTVHSDRERTISLLALLHRLADTHQVILFTQESTVRSWAEATLDGHRDRLLDLPPPSPVFT